MPLAHPVHGVPDDVSMVHRVAAELVGALEDLGAGVEGGGGDRFAVGRDEHGVDSLGFLRRGDRVGDERPAGDRVDVLVADRLAAGAGGDDRGVHSRVSRSISSSI